ncbi:hypothetical protein [Herbihabitans rhizosphaerae]|nr:hypothetical protein [Herbihabitans rhizosphaerae]
MLEIDTVQLDRYLNPNLGPLSPVYYVFPLPHWVGPLTSTSGSSPASLGGSAPAPPEWWRRRIGRSWFGEWLYVMSARAVSEALPVDWRSKGRAKLFTLDPTRPTSWATLFTRAPYSVPYLWRSFWSIVTKCGPWDSIRWRTVVDGQGRPDRVLVLDGDLEEGWHLGALLDQRRQLVKEQVIDHGVERAILHIPDSALY